jgi:uncharacterized protein YaiI (UPF0178 family)
LEEKEEIMQIYIDGDAFPNLLKPIVIRAINRLSLPTTVISNKTINLGKSEYVEYLIVEDGIDKADKKIVEMVNDNDLVITADIPLADFVIEKDAFALDHRGTLFTKENIKHHLSMRNLMQEIRDSGEITKGPKPFSQKDSQNFANSLNKFLQQGLKCN